MTTCKSDYNWWKLLMICTNGSNASKMSSGISKKLSLMNTRSSKISAAAKAAADFAGAPFRSCWKQNERTEKVTAAATPISLEWLRSRTRSFIWGSAAVQSRFHKKQLWQPKLVHVFRLVPVNFLFSSMSDLFRRGSPGETPSRKVLDYFLIIW